MNATYLLVLIVGLSFIHYNGGEFKFSHIQERLENHKTKICDALRLTRHILLSADNVIDAFETYERILKFHKTNGTSIEPPQSIQRKKRFLSNSFNPENWIRDAIKKLNLESLFTKIIEEINFKNILNQVIRNLDISGMLKQSFGDLNKLIEKHLDIPNLLLKQLEKIDIEPFFKKVIAQLDIFTVIKNKIGETNFEQMLNEIMKKVDLKQIFNDLMSRINIQETIKDILQYISTNEVIQKFLSALDIIEILQTIIDLLHLEEILQKLTDFNDATSPLRRFVEYVKLDEIIEHMHDLHWILQSMLPNISKGGISRIIEDFEETLEAVANSSTNIREILIDTTLKKGIPFLINTFDWPVINYTVHPKILLENSFNNQNISNTSNNEQIPSVSTNVRKKRANALLKLIRPEPKTNRILRILHVTMRSIISFFDAIHDTINGYYVTADMDVCW